MKSSILKNLLTIHAAIFTLYGVMDLFAGSFALQMFSDTATATGEVLMCLQMIGGSFLAFAVLMWGLRRAPLSRLRFFGLLSLTTGLAIATGIQVSAIASGVLNANNWVGVASSGGFGAAYAYFAWKDREALMATSPLPIPKYIDKR